MTTFAAHQPNYLPWLGYFAKMALADVFVFLDDVQMPLGRSYVSRTRIRDRDDSRWLTVPVRRHAGQAIDEVEFANADWRAEHVRTLRETYARSPHVDDVLATLEPLYDAPGERLAAFNKRVIAAMAEMLGLRPQFVDSSDLRVEGRGDERLVALGRRLGASRYVSGTGGENYQDHDRFAAAGIEITVKDYVPIEYDQAQGAFVPRLAAVDALANLGPSAVEVLRYP